MCAALFRNVHSYTPVQALQKKTSRYSDASTAADTDLDGAGELPQKRASTSSSTASVKKAKVGAKVGSVSARVPSTTLDTLNVNV